MSKKRLNPKYAVLDAGGYLVLMNGTIKEVELEDPHLFPDRKSALAYIDEQLSGCSDLDYYLFRIEEYHHTIFVRMMKKL